MLNEIIQIDTVKQGEQVLESRFPYAVSQNLNNYSLISFYDFDKIKSIIDFEEPFLKIDKVLTFSKNNENKAQIIKTVSYGKIYKRDVVGHYFDTLFLALCGQLMGQAASIFVAILNPGTAPQVIEVDKVAPALKVDQAIWKIREEGSPFFIESNLINSKLSLYVLETKVYFGNIFMGKTKGMKVYVVPRESFLGAKELPVWK